MKSPKGYLTFEEAESLVEAAFEPQHKLLLRFLWRTGARVSEVLDIQIKDINWSKGVVEITPLKKKVKTKRYVPIDKASLDMARKYLKTRSSKSLYLFEGYHQGHMARQTAYWIVRKTAESVGLEGIHPHSLRHSNAMYWIKKLGGSYETLRQIQMVLGHTSISTTAGYLNFSAEEVRSEYSKVFPD